MIPEPTIIEIQTAIKSLKNNKSPAEDGIPAELFKYGGDIIEQRLLKLFKIIWDKESKPEDWEIAVMIPIHKRGDKLDCSNYRGISVLAVAYKILTKIIYNRLLKYTEDIIGEYQCGFRPGRSTIDHIFSIRQILEKCYEYNVNHEHLFIDFRQAYDSIHRPSMWQILKEFGIPKKSIKMIQICTHNSRSKVKLGNKMSEPFQTVSGLRQGCILSPILFSLAMEKITRTIMNRPEGMIIGNNMLFSK